VTHTAAKSPSLGNGGDEGRRPPALREERQDRERERERSVWAASGCVEFPALQRGCSTGPGAPLAIWRVPSTHPERLVKHGQTGHQCPEANGDARRDIRPRPARNNEVRDGRRSARPPRRTAGIETDEDPRGASRVCRIPAPQRRSSTHPGAPARDWRVSNTHPNNSPTAGRPRRHRSATTATTTGDDRSRRKTGRPPAPHERRPAGDETSRGRPFWRRPRLSTPGCVAYVRLSLTNLTHPPPPPPGPTPRWPGARGQHECQKVRG
jgi:hypothetical protein